MTCDTIYGAVSFFKTGKEKAKFFRKKKQQIGIKIVWKSLKIDSKYLKSPGKCLKTSKNGLNLLKINRKLLIL